jgi:hypothetical protein
MKSTSITVLVLLACVTSACSGSSDSSNPSSPANQEEVSIPGSPDTESTTTSAPIVVNGEPMSAFTGGVATLPANIGEITDVSLRFPCNDFGNEQIDSYTMPGHEFAQCPSLDGGVVFTSLSSNFVYNEFPSIAFDDFPVETFAPSAAINTDQIWTVSPEGMIVYFVKMVGPDKVEVGVTGTANMIYAGIATIKAGETAWTIATFQEFASSDWQTDHDSVYLRDGVRNDTPLVSYYQDGLPSTAALARDGSILWSGISDVSEYPLHLNNAFSTIVGFSGNWIYGFLDPLTGNYENINPAYDCDSSVNTQSDPCVSTLVAFESHIPSNGQVLMFDNPGIFGKDRDYSNFVTGETITNNYVRLPESSRLTAGSEGTWRKHLECEVSRFLCGQDYASNDLATYITPSGQTFTWDRPLAATVGDNALFVEFNSGLFYIIGPNGEEVTQGEDTRMSPYKKHFTMDDKYLLFASSDDWSVIRVS